ncbi:hypothetical protein TYRP_008236 [Tyrophagus putrescentiae]|nr:hypothetical protein TYRP_008236 [Tyrophagus putrescentiae]
MMMMMKKKKREKRYSAALLIARANLVENLANAPMRATNSAMMLLLKLMQPPPTDKACHQVGANICLVPSRGSL